MADEFDGYECIPQDQFMMRRLLAFMRSSQRVCTDHMCIDDATPPGPSESNPGTNFLMMSMFLVALLIYFISPEAALPFTRKRRVSGNGDNQPPPPPAPPALN